MGDLRLQQRADMRLDRPAVFSQRLGGTGDEHSVGELVSVAIAEHALELLDGTERTPATCCDPGEAHGPALEGLGKRQVIDEQLERPRHPAVVLGGDDVQSVRGEHGLSERSKGCGLFPVGLWREEVEWQRSEIEDFSRHPCEPGIAIRDGTSDASGSRAGAVGPCNDDDVHLMLLRARRTP